MSDKQPENSDTNVIVSIDPLVMSGDHDDEHDQL
jgi:hypothetical protein